MIIPVSGLNLSSKNIYQNRVKNNQNKYVSVPNVSEAKPVAPINISTVGNATKISFKGKLKDPNYPSIQFKVRGVSHHQAGCDFIQNKDRNVERLADSNWYDGKKLGWDIATFQEGTRILIIDPKYGEIGRIPDEVAPYLIKLMRENEDDFTVELSNVVAGMTKGADTIGLRANLIYTGNNPKVKEKVQQTFDKLLNSSQKDIKDVIMVYQPKTTPKEVLQRIFSNVDAKKGEDAAFKVCDIIENIASEINNPKNKNILLLGHTNPDGDTIGCVLGMHAAIKANYPDKNVVCSIDDKIPGIYRDKLPGIHNITEPCDASTMAKLEQELADLKAKPQSFVTRNQIRSIEKELRALKANAAVVSPSGKKGEVPAKYDLVILMDVPSPSKFTNSYKKEIETAGKVIYIDHHRERFEEWDAFKYQNGVDIIKAKEQDLALVLPEVPATTELVTVIADNAKLLDKTLKHPEYSKQFVAGIVSGTSSDTGGFARTANYLPSDMSKPVQDRPNYLPEGLSKWLIDKLGNTVDKKWLRENIVYDLPDKKSSISANTPREKMINYALEAQTIFEENGLGIIGITFDQMHDIWASSKIFDRKVTYGDVQNSLKYCEVMGALREAPSLKTQNSVYEPYHSPYEQDKISVLLIQDKKKGETDDKGEIADTNSIRMSFRSQDGTVYSEMLASSFGGGGHGSAAGGRITLDGVELSSPLAIKVDGVIERDASNIYKAMVENYEIKNNFELTPQEAKEQMHKFETVIDEEVGLPINDLLNDIVTVIRRNPK